MMTDPWSRLAKKSSRQRAEMDSLECRQLYGFPRSLVCYGAKPCHYWIFFLGRLCICILGPEKWCLSNGWPTMEYLEDP